MNQIIVDGFGMAFRYHFAFIRFSTASGLLSGCVYGFMTGIRNLKNKYPDFHVNIAWDSEPKRKKAIYSEYKAQRPRFDLGSQIRDLKEIFSSVNVSQAEVSGEEADDVIASMVKVYSQSEGMVYVHSSDKDLLQLVKNGKVIQIQPGVGGSQEKACDEEAVIEKYGVKPKNFSCYLSFRGDSSDNIPGVARVPSKVIARLSEKYGDPRAVYASLSGEKLTDFQRKSFLDSENQMDINYEIIKLKENLNFVVTDGKTDVERLQNILYKYEIKSISASRFADLFEKESSFRVRKAPSFENYSLFEEK